MRTDAFEKQYSHALYRSALQSVADHLHVLNSDDARTLFSELIRVCGYEPTDELITHLELSFQKKLVQDPESCAHDEWYRFLCSTVMDYSSVKRARRRKIIACIKQTVWQGVIACIPASCVLWWCKRKIKETKRDCDDEKIKLQHQIDDLQEYIQKNNGSLELMAGSQKELVTYITFHMMLLHGAVEEERLRATQREEKLYQLLCSELQNRECNEQESGFLKLIKTFGPTVVKFLLLPYCAPYLPQSIVSIVNEFL